MAEVRQKTETEMNNPRRIDVEEHSLGNTYLVLEDDNHDVIRILLDEDGNNATAIYGLLHGRVHKEAL